MNYVSENIAGGSEAIGEKIYIDIVKPKCGYLGHFCFLFGFPCMTHFIGGISTYTRREFDSNYRKRKMTQYLLPYLPLQLDYTKITYLQICILVRGKDL